MRDEGEKQRGRENEGQKMVGFKGIDIVVITSLVFSIECFLILLGLLQIEFKTVCLPAFSFRM